MKHRLVEQLRCPIDKSKFQLVDAKTKEGSDEIIAGSLRSESGRNYPIVDGVPVLIDKSNYSADQNSTIESFSEKWRLAPSYRERTRDHYVNWYLERYGFSTLEGLSRFLSTKKRILEAGTGEGRDAELYAINSPAEVFAVDISTGIHVAYSQLSHIPNLHFIRADLQQLPFAENYFDFIACDQVMHHTPNTKSSFLALLQHLNFGHLAFYVYKVKGPVREFCDDHIRNFTTNMSSEECYKFSEALTLFGKSLTEQRLTIEVPVDIPLLGITKGRFDLQRWLYWNMFKCYWNESIDWNSNVITNFDWYHPKHAHRHTPDEIKGWIQEASLQLEHFSVVESGISVIAKKERISAKGEKA